jgi:hypothetical protein
MAAFTMIHGGASSRTVTWLLSTVALAAASGNGRATSGPSVTDVLKTLDVMSGRFATVAWNVKWTQGHISSNGAYQVIESHGHGKADVVLEPASGRFRADYVTVARWAGGSNPFLATRRRVTYDGARFVEMTREWPGTAIPGPVVGQPGTQEGVPWGASINKSPATFLRGCGWFTGIGWFVDRYWNVTLADRIRREIALKQPVVISADADNQWHIELTDRGVDDDRTRVEIVYDPARGIITGVTRKAGSSSEPWRRMDVKVQRVGNFWLPAELTWVYLLEKPITFDRIAFSNVRVNEPADNRVFQLEYPPGTQVVDFVEKKAFTVGQNATEEQQMIEAFVATYGLARPVQPDSRWRQVLLFSGCTMAAVVGLLVLRRIFKKQKAGVAAIVAFLLVGDQGTAGPEQNAKPHLSQCGFQVTLFACSVFGIQVDANAVLRDLQPAGHDGISLGNIQRVLKRHGCSVEARKGTTVRELRNALNAGWMAITPVSGGPTCHDYDFSGKAATWNHFVVATLQSQKGPVVVDVLRSVTPLDKTDLSDIHLRDPQRVVLFVRR